MSFVMFLLTHIKYYIYNLNLISNLYCLFIKEEHYADLASKKFFPGLIEYMTSGPVCK